jgi:hypothetical protein
LAQSKLNLVKVYILGNCNLWWKNYV